MTSHEAPELLEHNTWRDEQDYHSRHVMDLPEDAIQHGCLQEIHADTPIELTRKAVNNRAQVAMWTTGMSVPAAGDLA